VCLPQRRVAAGLPPDEEEPGQETSEDQIVTDTESGASGALPDASNGHTTCGNPLPAALAERCSDGSDERESNALASTMVEVRLCFPCLSTETLSPLPRAALPSDASHIALVQQVLSIGTQLAAH
jgi:hypothetical protein